ncbi:g9341 [Coccomyxa elongata]
MNGIERDREEQVAVRKDEERKRERLGEESREKTGQCEAIRRELGSKDAFKKHKAVTEEDFEAASESFGRDFYRTVNLGVVGYTGTGKSSLINSLREMRCTDRGAAPVNDVETKARARGYEVPGDSAMRYWDFPGGGTVGHPIRGYFEEHRLYALDALVVNTDGTMKDLDLKIIDLAAIYKIPVALVRNKSEVKEEGEVCIDEFRIIWNGYARDTMRRDGVPWDGVDIFIISTHKDQDYRDGIRNVPFGDSDALREWIKELSKRTESKSKTHKRLQERYRDT